MAGKQEGPSNTNAEWTYIVTIVVFAGIIALLWFKLKPLPVRTAFAIDWVEMKFLALIGQATDSDKGILNRLQGHFDGRYDPWDITWDEFYRLLDNIGTRMRFYVAAMISGLGVLLIFKMKGDNFRNSYDLKKLMGFQQLFWKTIAPAVAYDPDDKGNGMEPSMTPFEWLDKNGIENTPGALTGIGIKTCENVFKQQLKDQWQGVKELPLHPQCIAVMAGVHSYEGNKDIKIKKGEGLTLRQKISVAHATIKDAKKRDDILRSYIKPYLDNPLFVKGVNKQGGKHNYVSTALMRLVDWSRTENGVFASAEFLWLKPLDRSLWYALNNVGRRAFHTEGAASVSHFNAEKIVRSPILEPNVDAAVEAIQTYLKDMGTDSNSVLHKKQDDDE